MWLCCGRNKLPWNIPLTCFVSQFSSYINHNSKHSDLLCDNSELGKTLNLGLLKLSLYFWRRVRSPSTVSWFLIKCEGLGFGVPAAVLYTVRMGGMFESQCSTLACALDIHCVLCCEIPQATLVTSYIKARDWLHSYDRMFSTWILNSCKSRWEKLLKRKLELHKGQWWCVTVTVNEKLSLSLSRARSLSIVLFTVKEDSTATVQKEKSQMRSLSCWLPTWSH